MRCYESLPYGWYLECTTAGTTGISDITIPSPLDVGDTVTDGTVVWTIRKIGSGDGFAIGDIKQIAHNGTIQDGWLECDGRAVSRTMFPDLFSAIGTTYGAGDGSTTFNLPNYADGKFPEGSTVAGTVKQPGLPNITGSTPIATNDYRSQRPSQATGAMQGVDGSRDGDPTGSCVMSGTMTFDASRSSAIYGASDTVQPYSLTTRFVIKAYDGVTPTPSQADISEMLTELTNKADRDLDNLSADGENHFLENDFTIIYPNGGSEANPANITLNSRYVEANPFPGYRVNCVAEIFINNNWAAPFFDGNSGTGTAGYGTKASQLNDGDIVVQTGKTGVLGYSMYTGNAFGDSSSLPTSAPCRVKVWKIGKIPT
jgi:microcystin-dependent protein